MADDDAERLLVAIRDARAALPANHRHLLDQLRLQEVAVEAWPRGVINLYATLREPAPSPDALDGAAAVWLDGLRTVAFNVQLLQRAVDGLNASTRRTVVAQVAWHEYGHALSVVRATPEHRRRGIQLLALLPDAVRAAIDYPGRYRTSQVFDEIIATLYALLVGRVRTAGYVRPEYLHPDVFAAFKEVIPWP
ncbi:MAG: hypothetical protein JWR63_603 [Conexibacter sp.]|nr:hypothetical protein [Conexibacter sp.]